MQTRLIRLKEVIKMTGLSRSSIYRYISENRFPESVDLGARSVAWLESEIMEWIEQVIGKRDNNRFYGYN